MAFRVRARCPALLTVVLLSGSLAWAQDQPPADPAEVVAKPPADDRRTTAHFVSNLGRNIVGVFSRDNLKPFVLGAAATGVSTAFDDDVKEYFAPTRRAKWLGDAVDGKASPT